MRAPRPRFGGGIRPGPPGSAGNRSPRAPARELSLLNRRRPRDAPGARARAAPSQPARHAPVGYGAVPVARARPGRRAPLQVRAQGVGAGSGGWGWGWGWGWRGGRPSDARTHALGRGRTPTRRWARALCGKGRGAHEGGARITSRAGHTAHARQRRSSVGSSKATPAAQGKEERVGERAGGRAGTTRKRAGTCAFPARGRVAPRRGEGWTTSR